MMRAALGIVAAVACLAVTVAAEAQPRTFTNLQIFPKDVGADVLIAAMKNFTRALGVRCQFCHVGEEGMPLDKFDFAADIKPTKATARAMIRMTAEINSHVDRAIADAAAKGYQVTCFTCHRGAQHPQHAPDVQKPPGS
jgi:photosynthetic reaction center cytochrome c subunit